MTDRRLIRTALAFGVITSLTVAAAEAQTASPASIKKGKVDQITVHGRSLESNLSGDSADRAVLDQYLTNLKKYSFIGLEGGTQDTLAESNRQLDRAMTTFGITHTFETYEGDHTNRVAQRFEENVLAFSKALSLTAPARSTARR